MVDEFLVGFCGLLLTYIVAYIYIFFKYIVSWLSIALVEVFKLTIFQLVMTLFYFIPGLGIFIVCVILLGMIVLDN